MVDLFPTPMPLPLWVKEALASPTPKWLIPNFIPSQGLVVVAGRPKIAKKSWFAYAAAMSLASGRHVGPFKPERKAKVLFYSREGAPGPIAHRFLALQRGMGLSIAECEGLYWVQNGSVLLDDKQHIKNICREVATNGFELVVFDTFARSFTGNENDARDVGGALRGVEKIRDCGAATMLVHHLGKTKPTSMGGVPDPDAGLRGSSALAGAYDNIVSIQDFEVEGERETWAIVGGKYLDFQAYEQTWVISGDAENNPVFAELKLEGPQPLPVVDSPVERVRF